MDKIVYNYNSNSDDDSDNIPINELLKRKQQAEFNDKKHTDKRPLDVLSSQGSTLKKNKTQEDKILSPQVQGEPKSSELQSSFKKRKRVIEERTENPKDSDDNIFRKLPDLIEKEIKTDSKETYFISRNVVMLQQQIESTQDDTSNTGAKELIDKVNKLHF
jgi:hypothetical protein